MKFWELISAFRGEKENLIAVLSQSKWVKYSRIYEHYHQIATQQNPEILNEKIPFELAKEVCEKSKLSFFYYPLRNPQIISKNALKTDEPYDKITPLEVLLRFEGSYIEEILEKGSIKI